MRRIASAAGLTLLLVFALAGTALAGSGHYNSGPTITVSGNSLTISGKAAGLGNIGSVNIALTGTVEVSARCYTRKNNTPQAANKQETANVNQTGDFPARNGSVTFSFTVTPLSTLDCPNGQRVVIESIAADLHLDWPSPYDGLDT